MARVFVLGSLNMDTTYYVNDLPCEGETIAAVSCESAVGGKGLNQAAAAAWTGVETAIIGAVGNDGNGRQMALTMERRRINTQYLQQSRLPTGSAIILVDGSARNFIVVNGGANCDVRREEIDLAAGDWIMSQLETPVETVHYYFEKAKQACARTVLNLSPYQPVPDTLLALTDILIVNEHEASGLLQCRINSPEDACNAAEALRRKGVHKAVITLGERGAVVLDGNTAHRIEGVKVKAVDTQGAGDAFSGVMIGYCCRGLSLPESAEAANRIAGQCVGITGSTIISLDALDRTEEGKGNE